MRGVAYIVCRSDDLPAGEDGVSCLTDVERVLIASEGGLVERGVAVGDEQGGRGSGLPQLVLDPVDRLGRSSELRHNWDRCCHRRGNTMVGEGQEVIFAHRAVRNVNVVHLEVAASRSVRADGEHTCIRVMLSRQLGRLVDV
jgi:hypothetical protein